jgi:hypothetical protein
MTEKQIVLARHALGLNGERCVSYRLKAAAAGALGRNRRIRRIADISWTPGGGVVAQVPRSRASHE